ncbi:MAG: ROK family protein [Bacteroidales bacterium]|nr:ROK family protein [Bacteroidales bacterium]
MTENKRYIGLDLGGTKVLAARVNSSEIEASAHRFVPKDNGDENQVIDLLKEVISELINDDVEAIGIGLPSIVDAENGVVYDVQNIPSWKEVHLVGILKDYFKLPVYINNDANCYALGEVYYGLAKNCDSLVGITLGTGLGGGIVINGSLLKDATGAAGEFGVIPYLDKTLEAYCSGQFFTDHYNTSGEIMAERARKGDDIAIKAYQEFGKHIGNAVKIIISTIDPEMIIIGGSVAQSNDLFEKAMLASIQDYPFERSKNNIKVEFSETNNMAVLGASTLCFQDSK